MKTLLFDLQTGGHHLRYASLIGRYLTERGDDTTFVTSRSDTRVQAMMAGCDVEVIEALPDQRITTRRGQLSRFRDQLKALDVLTSILKDVGPDILHFLCIDRLEIPLSLRRQMLARTSVFGSLAKPYGYGRGGASPNLPTRMHHKLRAALLTNLLNGGAIQGLFVFDGSVREDLLDGYLSSVDGDRIWVNNELVEPPETTLSRRQARERLNLVPDRPLFLFFGALRFDKGPDNLARALSGLEDREFTVVFAGSKDHFTALDLDALLPSRSRFGVEYRLHFIPEDEVDLYFSAADAVVLPYRDLFAGTSAVIPRAAANGTPLVTTPVGAAGPMVERHGIGTVAADASPAAIRDCLCTVLDDPEGFRSSTTDNLAAFAERFHWRKVIRRIRERYAESLG